MPPSRDHPPDPPLDEQKPLSTRAPAEYNSNPFEVLSPLSLPGNATATPFDTPLSTPFGASSSTRASGSTVSSGTALARLLGYPAGKTDPDFDTNTSSDTHVVDETESFADPSEDLIRIDAPVNTGNAGTEDILELGHPEEAPAALGMPLSFQVLLAAAFAAGAASPATPSGSVPISKTPRSTPAPPASQHVDEARLSPTLPVKTGPSADVSEPSASAAPGVNTKGKGRAETPSGSSVPSGAADKGGAPKPAAKSKEPPAVAIKTFVHLSGPFLATVLDGIKSPKNPLRDAPWPAGYAAVNRKRMEDVPWMRNPDRILESINMNLTTIIFGEPGTGKSSQVPQLAAHWVNHNKHRLGSKRVLVVCPDETAGELLLKRIKSELGLDSTRLIVRLTELSEDLTEAQTTKVVIATPQVLIRALSNDNQLRQYAVVIMDDLQLRQTYQDLLLSELRALVSSQSRPDLRLILMTANFDTRRLEAGFGSDGLIRLDTASRYSPTIRYVDQAVGDYPDHVLHRIKDRYRSSSGPVRTDTVVFCYNARQVRKITRGVQYALSTLGESPTDVHPLHAGIPLAERLQVVSRQGTGSRAHIFVTDSTSELITFSHAGLLFDSGYQQISAYDPTTDSHNLVKVALSQEQANHRATRIVGQVERVYTQEDFEALEPLRDPEISYSDFSKGCLARAYIRRNTTEAVPWPRLMTPPSLFSVIRAIRTLRLLSALDADMRCTRVGAVMANLPMGLHIARAAIAGSGNYHCGTELVDMAAAVTKGDRMFRDSLEDEAFYAQVKTSFKDPFGDFGTLLNVYRQYLAYGDSHNWFAYTSLVKKTGMEEVADFAHSIGRTMRMIEQDWSGVRSTEGLGKLNTPDPNRFDTLGRALSAGFFPRLIEKTVSGQWVTSDGHRPVSLSSRSACSPREAYLLAGEFVFDPFTGRCIAENLTPVTQDQILAIIPFHSGHSR